MHALRIIQKGDMPASQMKGAWAGELGQLQFLPSSYSQHLRVTKIDGIIGEETRGAVRLVQQSLGLPADGYPDLALLQSL